MLIIRINYSDGDDHLYGENGDDYLRGGDGKDKLDGGDGIDEIAGGNGDDTLKGGVGNDVLYGDNGKDKLNGGVGADTFVYESLTDSTKNVCDIIQDFNYNQKDQINVSSLGIASFDDLTQQLINGASAVLVQHKGSDFAFQVCGTGLLTENNFIFAS